MTEQDPKTMTIPTPKKTRSKRWLPSLIWIIPIVAALIGLTMVVKTLVNKGPVVEISFNSAEGLEAGKTRVKYKDVNIGTVDAIRLSEDRSHVIVQVQFTKAAESFAVKDSRFWIVRPRVAASGVSGLGTLFSGAYIGVDGGNSKEKSMDFVGLEVPPLVTRDASGKQFILHAKDLGSLDIGSPVYFRHVKVGQVTAYNLDEDGQGVSLRIFVSAPYDKFVGLNTRFWHASGFDLQLNANGFKVQTQSVMTVVLGGLAFQTADDMENPPAAENTVFALASDQASALKQPDGTSENLLVYFNQSLRGLSPGASVEFRGVVLGEVKSIGIDFDAKSSSITMPVLIQIYPDRLGKASQEDEEYLKKTYKISSRLQLMQRLVTQGLRAQLQSGNLLTGQVFVALDFFPKAPPGTLTKVGNTFVLPSVPGKLDELQTQMSEILSKLSKVPFDQIGVELKTTLQTLNTTLQGAEKLTEKLNNDVAPEILSVMKEARKTLNAAEQTLSEGAPLQQDIRQTLQELTRTATSVRIVTDYLQQHPEALLRGKPKE
jgi:paraquat-inducible protein B